MRTGDCTNSAAASLRAAAVPVYHPAFDSPVRATVYERPEGDDQATEQTVSHMRMLTKADAGSAIVRAAAEAATRGAVTIAERLAGIHRFIRGRVRFVDDAITAGLAGFHSPTDTEVLIRPADLLAMTDPQGDCDDFAMLTAALLLAAGIPAQLRTIAADPREPGTFTHVFAEAITPAGPVPMDTSHGREPGWRAPSAGKDRTWRVDNMQTLGATPSWIQDLIKTGVDAASQIATKRYAAPPPGYYRTGPSEAEYRQQPGAGPLAFPGGSFGLDFGSYGPLFVMAGLGLVLVLATRKRG